MRRGIYGTPPPAHFFALIFLINFFRHSRQFASYSRKIIENLQFAVKIEMFSKTTFICPITTYSGLCSSDPPYMKIVFLVWFLGLGVTCSENKFEVRRSPAKIMLIFTASPNIFERRDAHIQAYAAASEQQNCSNSMWKLAREPKVEPLDCARSALHTEPNFIFGPL